VLTRSTKARVLDAWVAAGGLAPLRHWLADFAAAHDDEACQLLLRVLVRLPALHPDRIKEAGLGKLVGKLRKDHGPASPATTAAAGSRGERGEAAATAAAVAAAAAAAATRALADRVAATWRLLLRGVSGAKALGAPSDALHASAAAAAAGNAAAAHANAGAASAKRLPGAMVGSGADPRAAKRPRAAGSAASDVMGDALGSGQSGGSKAALAGPPRDRAAEMRQLREERIAQRRALKKGEALTHVMASKPAATAAATATSSVLASLSAAGYLAGAAALAAPGGPPGLKKLSEGQLAARQAGLSRERAERQANLLERSRAAAAAAAHAAAAAAGAQGTVAASSGGGAGGGLYGARDGDGGGVPGALLPVSSMDVADEYDGGPGDSFYGDSGNQGDSGLGGLGSGGGGGKSAGKKLRWLDEEGGELEAVREFATDNASHDGGEGGGEGASDDGGGGGGGASVAAARPTGSLADKRRLEANKEKCQMEEARAALEAEAAARRLAAWSAVDALANECWPQRQSSNAGGNADGKGDGGDEGGYRRPAALGGALAVDRDGDGLDSMEVKHRPFPSWHALLPLLAVLVF
jgi:hypothetical protein